MHALAQVGEDADAADGLSPSRMSAAESSTGTLSPLESTTSVRSPSRRPAPLRIERMISLATLSGYISRTSEPSIARLRPGEDALGRPVEEQDAPLHVGADDGVDGRVDDALEEVLRLFQLGLDGALLVTSRKLQRTAPSSRRTELNVRFKMATCRPCA